MQLQTFELCHSGIYPTVVGRLRVTRVRQCKRVWMHWHERALTHMWKDGTFDLGILARPAQRFVEL